MRISKTEAITGGSPNYQHQNDKHMKTNISTVIESISPQKAREYLQCNTGNRSIRMTHVRYLMDLIERGEWLLTHQGIAFDIAGVLKDGQHRLVAVSMGTKTVQMMVTRGLDCNTMMGIDRQITKSISDVTGIPKRQADVFNIFALLITSGDLTGKVSPQKVLQVAKVFGEMTQLLDSEAPTSRASLTSAPIRAAAVLAALAGNPEAMKQYRAITVLDFNEMCPVVQSFVKQLVRGGNTGRGGMRELLFVRAMTAFDPESRNNTKIQIKDVKPRLERARNMILHLLSK